MMRSVLLFLALFFVALTSGAAFAIYLETNPSGVSSIFYAEKMQHAIRVFTVPLNTVAILGVLFTIASTLLARRDRLSFYLLIAASICLIAGTLITLFGNVPIINQIMTWSSTSPPSNWIELGEKWSRFQTVRTILQTAALALVILSTLFRRDISK
jgi:anthrone oxygenase-like protein